MRDLFAIFPDLPWPRPVRPHAPQLAKSVQYPHPPATRVARRRLKLRRPRTDSALRRIRDIAQSEYERLTPKDQIGQALRAIMAIADEAGEI